MDSLSTLPPFLLPPPPTPLLLFTQFPLPLVSPLPHAPPPYSPSPPHFPPPLSTLSSSPIDLLPPPPPTLTLPLPKICTIFLREHYFSTM